MRGVDGERLRSVAVTLTLLFAAASGAVAGGVSASGGSASNVFDTAASVSDNDIDGSETDKSVSGADNDGFVAQENTTTAPGGNNTTVNHRNPGLVGEGSNASDVESWLQDRMVERLVRSIDVSDEDSERARRLVGNDSKFEEFADKYAELKGTSGNESANLSDLDGVGAIQGAFLADVNDYRTTLQRYQRVRENGTTRRERLLAHELERRLAAVNRSAAALQRSYTNVSAAQATASTARNATTNATRQIERVRTDVLATQQTVRNQTLVRTTLSVDAVAANGSFTDRVRLRGQLATAANGSAVGPRNVTLRVENRTVRTRTNATGHFEVDYRPTLASVGDRTRTVQFRPANSSRYLRDNATVRFGVERAEPELEITNATESVGFGDSLTVAGAVRADNVTTSDVPVVATLAGFPVGRTTTGPNGSFSLSTTVPANLSTGERPVRVRLADRRFRAANVTSSVAVEPTATDLSVREIRQRNGNLFVSGRLTAEEGAPLANRTLQLSVNGTAVGTVTTNATGSYAAVVPVPSSVGERARVGTAYSPTGGNLRASSADGTVTFETGERNSSDFPLAFRVAGLAGLAVIGVVLARRLGGNDWGRGDDPTPDDSAAASDLSETIPADAGLSAAALLDAATERLDGDGSERAGDRDDAALLAYAAARKRLDGSVGRASAETHWEFYDDCRATLREERLADLRRLTETYERAAFAADSISESAASEAVEAAARAVESGSDADSADGN